MKLHEGNYWSVYDNADLFLFTSNGEITKSGCLVMGAGNAKQVKNRFPGIDRLIGEHIIQSYSAIKKNLYSYNLLISPNWPRAKIGAFQTKLSWKDPSPIELIEKSLEKLNIFALSHSDKNIHMPAPGIGHGKLSYDQMIELTNILPNNVHIWVYK